ncbi:uncharacterized protein PHALS_13213 [Plasmopara halstedii]|uniref:Ubiquitin-like domain-containing protein n=1 Tax=Plasmopara halstedii TaxID=4781 RepID=A0A0P1ANH9_PLAHL|nr:uncharacterized protein PHALS_13213 [Plasmopara halstedii]CEG42983.1 hypothetical protein PHALS_13213 [Plasmopara halstedii]|eukprot:XP_024579352.1 hypothetical protein PHALS_13213 [Plasmopara halstedii]
MTNDQVVMSFEALRSPSNLPLLPAVPINPENTVTVHVRDYNGIAQPVVVPVGSTLSELLNAAFRKASFGRGAILGLEDDNLQLYQCVTAVDATRWTADQPLQVKYKRPSCCEKMGEFADHYMGWVVAFIMLLQLYAAHRG